jgi:AbrB family looped-hinge helix DNA binding protein
MESNVKVSSKFQIVIPRKARNELKIQAGDQLMCRVENGEILLRPRPESYAKFLRGLHKELWEDADAAQYVSQERRSWE